MENQGFHDFILVGEGPNADHALTVVARAQRTCQRVPMRDVLSLLRSGLDPDVVILCPHSNFDSYAELCRTIKLDSRTRHVSVVFMIDRTEESEKTRLYEAGADDCVFTQMSQREIVLRFEKAIRLKHATDSMEDASAMVTALANAVEGKDHYTCGHVDRVGMYAVEIGRRLGLGPRELAALKTGGIVHDIGKIGIPDHILNKPGKLTDQEMGIMRRHPVIGFDILQPLRTFRDVLPIVRWHHEKPNGSGYPDGISGENLPRLPRIMSVADVFDALSTDRPYRKAFPLEECIRIMKSDVEKDNLDGDAVTALIAIVTGETQSAAA